MTHIHAQQTEKNEHNQFTKKFKSQVFSLKQMEWTINSMKTKTEEKNGNIFIPYYYVVRKHTGIRKKKTMKENERGKKSMCRPNIFILLFFHFVVFLSLQFPNRMR